MIIEIRRPRPACVTSCAALRPLSPPAYLTFAIFVNVYLYYRGAQIRGKNDQNGDGGDGTDGGKGTDGGDGGELEKGTFASRLGTDKRH